MIPKTIHYCWFGNHPLPEYAKKCISSWRKFLPDYEIKEWNESNFNVNIIPFTREAYRLKKYAFVSDYARMWILYHYGGLYFDTDVELIRSIDDVISRGAFMGCEAQDDKQSGSLAPHEVTTNANGTGLQTVNPGLGLGCAPGLGLYKKILDWYSQHHFVTWSGKFAPNDDIIIVSIVSRILKRESMQLLEDGVLLVDNIYVYPPEYFCPKNYFTSEMHITTNTRSIHHYSASWMGKDIHKPTIWKRICKRVKFFIVRIGL